jgi:hypothetical protein
MQADALLPAGSLPGLAQIKRIAVFKPLKLRQIRFLSALLKCNMVITKASLIAKCDWRNHYWWLENPDYKQAYIFTKEMLGDVLEYTMLDHAIAGREADIVYKGKVTGMYKDINASERITLLKGMKPQYRESYSPAGAAAPVQIAIVYPGAPVPAIDVTPKKQDE